MRIALSILLLVCLPSYAQTYIEGTHYTINEDVAASDLKEVVEYFSFSCPGCYAMEPLIVSMLNEAPELNFRRVHAPFGGRSAELSQKVFVLAKLLDAERHTVTIFERIHRRKNLFDNDQEIMNFFIELGYEKSMVEENLNSFTADTMIRKMNKQISENQIVRVPNIVVNGRYRINPNSIHSGQGLAALVNYLYALAD